ncbi:PKD domain-containing protein [Salegentibacter sp. BLCTC]|uniref:PKD domain-containing protein n=1 Tax=Salegentibacter sp. BLCTC TaxID=2697368 RepID=UPI00187B4B11|nr:PKD domain-containing protein [Salegentibacter sp. BLCTC]MBE7641367.1 PKD domain-containing protein [Salegentibacter sp. BLCTC]
MQQKSFFKSLILIGGILLFSSCSKDDGPGIIPMEFADLNYQKDYELTLGDTLSINPEILNLPEGTGFSWKLGDDKVSEAQNLHYAPKQFGTFALQFKALANNDSLLRSYEVTVNDPYQLYFRPKTENSSKYISEIIEYKPAPGQYINKTYGSLESAEKLVGGKSAILSLGAWGGYVTFTFDHTIENREDAKDFVVYGNAMGGLSEPGIVKVSFDENGNGLPDDTWYELAGSAHQKEETILNYQLTYTNPKEYANVPWEDNQENQDSVMVNPYHSQNYYPLFIEEKDKMSFNGTRVYPKVSLEGFASIDALEWGYVDNFDADYNTYAGNAMDLDWAVDDNMNPVALRGVDFISVYTGAQGNVGWLGEISTEIKGASDLSMTE